MSDSIYDPAGIIPDNGPAPELPAGFEFTDTPEIPAPSLDSDPAQDYQDFQAWKASQERSQPLPGIIPPARVADQVPKFDISQLTLNELSTVERIAKAGISSFGDSDRPQSGFMQAITLVIKQRQDPTYTLAKAGTITLEEFGALVGADDEEPTPEEAAEAAKN